MRRVSPIVVVLVLCAGGALPAAAGELGIPDDAQRVAEIQAQMMAGNTDEAVKAARAFVKTTKDENSKTEAMRVIAEALRKKGDWRGAIGAYRGLRDRFDKSSDDYIRFTAIADVIAGSQNGIYKGGGTVKPAPGTQAKKLSDDEALDAALALLAKSRCTRLKSRGTQLRRTRTPQDVMNVFRLAAGEAREIFLLGPNTPPDDARAVGKMAAQRLAKIHAQVTVVLQKKLQGYQQKKKFQNPWSFTNVEKKDVKQTHQLCKDMGAAEKEFQTALFHVTGSGEWLEGDSFRTESNDRAAAYEQLAEAFIVPAYRSIWGW